MTANRTNRRWLLDKRPHGIPTPDVFRLEEGAVPAPDEGEVLVRNKYISVDPGMRSRLSGDSYAPGMKVGQVIDGFGLGVVEDSKNEKFARGDLVTGGFGWSEYFVADGRGLLKIDPALFEPPLSETAAIGVLGIPGLTAYFGLLDLGRPKEGETVLVSSAAGPVGATAGQIAKIKGCRAVGIAGSDDKCRYVTGDLGFDAAINYKTCGDLAAAIANECPKGVDIYFDNVGGETLDAALDCMNMRGRIVVSGQVSEYNRDEPRGIRKVTYFITKRLRMEGLVVFDYLKEFRPAMAEMAGWIREGRLTYTEEIFDGIDKAPEAFIGLFKGENLGRRLIKIS